MTARRRPEAATKGMTLAEVLALPVAVTLDDANRALGIGRSAGYAMAKSGTYPLETLKLGRAYRIRRADLLELLGIAQPEPAVRQLRGLRPGEQREHPQLRIV
ncbi:integrase [Streptomyces sp. NPDC046977]|uniref:integrase n=1 Tax=Streptomyces sp. NPDC046977 TaxID=3154703 RepID=UPI0033D2E260